METQLKCSGWCENTSSLFYRFTDVNKGKPEGVCYKKLSELIRHYMLIESVLAFLTSGLCLIAFVGGLSFMCGRRSFRALGDAGYNTAHQLTNLNATSIQQPSLINAKPLTVSNVVPTGPPPGYAINQQSQPLVDASGNSSYPMNRQSQARFLPPLARSSSNGFRA